MFDASITDDRLITMTTAQEGKEPCDVQFDIPLDHEGFLEISSMQMPKSDYQTIKKCKKTVPVGILEQMAKNQNKKKI